MPVNHEIKSQLAKLLATEDLVVEHKKVETACFNVHTRVLTLPMWEGAGNEIYDMLVAHEVGHALYTPDRDWLKEVKVPPQFVNVVEDVRIEKMMKRRYAGLSKTFYKGYQELSNDDFFQIGDDDLETYNLADKVNLYYKIGNFVNVPFDDFDEMPIVRMIGECETFSDVLIAAEFLYKFCTKKQKKESNISIDNLESQSSGSDQPGSEFFDQQEGENDQQENVDEMNSYGGTASNETTPEMGDTTQDMSGNENEDLEVKTMDSLEDAIRELTSVNGIENVYIELPKVNLDNIVIANQEIHNICDETWKDPYDPKLFDCVDIEFAKFKKSAQKEVNYLVKEFECRKSADSYARATTSRTGVLDCTKLHTYKYNEDIFKKVTTLADGKNHGLIFILDWSGSMGNVMLDTMKQLFNLIWFCKKVGIPFEVYAFTNEYPRVKYDEDENRILRMRSYEAKDGLMEVGEWFSLMNILTHNVNSKTLDHQMKNIFRLGWSNSRYATYPTPQGLGLSGTPLNETMIALHQIIPQFKKNNKTQKVQCVVLTDGEGYCLKYHREIKRHWESESFIGVGSIGQNSFLRDRKTGNTYFLGGDWFEITDTLLRNLRDKFIDTNFIGIRVLESRDANSFIRRYVKDNFDKVQNDWKKQRAFSIKNSGYHSYIGLSANSLSQNSEFDVHETATKAQIKSAFVKSLKSKKMNKKILNEFVELVA